MMSELLETIPDRADLEVILVDDHSECPFNEDVSFKRTSLVHIRNLPGQKYAGTARNAGLLRATGDYVLFADSDDLFVTEALERVLDEAGTMRGRDMILFGVSSFEVGSAVPSRRHCVFENARRAFAKTGDRAYLPNLLPPWGRLVRRDLIESHGLRFEATRVSNDVRFSVMLALLCRKVVVVEEVAYLLRKHPGSLTADHDIDAIRTRLGVFFRANRIFSAYGNPYRFSTLIYIRQFRKTHPLMALRLTAWSLTQPGAVLITRRQIVPALRYIGRRVGRATAERAQSIARKLPIFPTRSNRSADPE